MSRLVLIGGGARSGKSRFAETTARALEGPRAYVATAEPFDDELRARIARHRADRGDAFETVETPLTLAQTLESLPHPVVVVDCLTLWLGNLLHHGWEDERIEDEIAHVARAARGRHGTTCVVINEVGLGIVPDNAMARAFRDHAGRLHQKIGAIAGEVHFIAAGLPLKLKG